MKTKAKIFFTRFLLFAHKLLVKRVPSAICYPSQTHKARLVLRTTTFSQNWLAEGSSSDSIMFDWNSANVTSGNFLSEISPSREISSDTPILYNECGVQTITLYRSWAAPIWYGNKKRNCNTAVPNVRISNKNTNSLRLFSCSSFFSPFRTQALTHTHTHTHTYALTLTHAPYIHRAAT